MSERDNIEALGNNVNTNTYLMGSYAMAPVNMLKEELSGVYGSELLKDLTKTIANYSVYEAGADFATEGAKDYTPSNMKHRLTKSLINKEARFMFSRTPNIQIKSHELTSSKDKGKIAAVKQKINDTQAFVNEVLKKNRFGIKLIQGAKDCFIGKRIAIFLDYNERGIFISLAPALEFIYEVDPDDVNRVTKIVRFWTVHDSVDKSEQRIYKKKYEMIKDTCYITEGIYNGQGVVVEEKVNISLGKQEVPAYVIINDGLTGDPMGESEVDALKESEAYYSKLSNADIDALRKGMNQVVYTIDATGTDGMNRAPGSYVDLATDELAQERGSSAKVGTIDNPMGYSTALDSTLKRIKNMMYELLDMPETSSEALQGVITSGKTLKALYWGLMTRCDEKMHVWAAAFEWLASMIIKVASENKQLRNLYNEKGNLLKDYFVEVENNYPLLEDELEEKANDLMQVNTGTMSRKSFMKKWRSLTDEEAEAEVVQIVAEKEIDDSYAAPQNFGNEGAED